MYSAVEIAKKAELIKEEIEAQRILPSHLVDEVKESGLVKKWATKAMGGEEASVLDVTSMISDMAYYNGSIAWVVGVTGCSALISGFISEEDGMPIFSDPKAMVGGFAGPAGIGLKVDDGLVVTGHWSWGSGIDHCTHIVGGVRIMDGDQIIGTAVVLFDPSEVEIIDNWHVIGLKGTRSVDYKVKDLKIPNERWFPFPVGAALTDSPLYRFSFLGALSTSVAAVGLGLAQRALDEIKTLAKVKSPFGHGKPLYKRPIFQSTLARLEGDFQAGSSLLKSAITDAENEARKGECSDVTKAQIRLASAHAVSFFHSVVQGAFNLGGGSSIWQSHKLEELIRDMNVVKQHGLVNDLNYRTVGAVLLGEQVPPSTL